MDLEIGNQFLFTGWGCWADVKGRWRLDYGKNVSHFVVCMNLTVHLPRCSFGKVFSYLGRTDRCMKGPYVAFRSLDGIGKWLAEY